MGIEFHRMAIVVFAFGQGLLDLFATSDVDDRHGDANDFVDLIACWLIGEEQGACCPGSVRIGNKDLEPGVRFTVEGAPEIRFDLRKSFGDDFSDRPAEVGSDG